ncbi:hypothetical protein IQ238_13905 [Pleurocapsales cyanobacterium LEGE 06147]|nr:hypothetical protein [Pleurocapsales cyanobacterium LEGE 06147]
MKNICFYLLLICLSWSLLSCGEQKIGAHRFEPTPGLSLKPVSTATFSGKLSEVAPPNVIQQLRKNLDQYYPQVSIIAPRADEVFQQTTVSVKLQVQDLPIFKDEQLGMGPHLHLILDNEPYRAIYDSDKPIALENLAPGTHTLRVFASRPWYESFKNEGAYAQTTFHILTKTNNNRPDPTLPLLTYSRPQGTYGAEPIMLDFYLTNTPLHLVAQENPKDEIKDWRIRATVNGESFIIDEWQPMYLKGFQKGNNWVQLELLDEDGNNIENAFNNTVRLVNYEPKEKDTLAKLVEGKISVEEARPIVEAGYRAKVAPIPEATETPIFEEKEPVKPEIKQEEEATEPEITTELPSSERIPSPETEIPIVKPQAPSEEKEIIEEKSQRSKPATTYTPPSVTEKLNPPTQEIIETRETTLDAVPISEQTSVEEKTVETTTEIPTTLKEKKREFKTPQWLKSFRSRIQRIRDNADELLEETASSTVIENAEENETKQPEIDTIE